MNDLLCAEHSGVCARMDQVEADVGKLWEKWDVMQRLVITACIASVMSLAGIIGILVTK